MAVRVSGTGEECARAIKGADSMLLEDRERTWVLVKGERLRGRTGKVKVLGWLDDGESVGESGADTRRWGEGRP